MNNAFIYAANYSLLLCEHLLDSVPFLKPYFVYEKAVWIVENVPQKAIIHSETIAEISRFERGVTNFPSELGFKRTRDDGKYALIKVVADDKKINLRFKNAGKQTGERGEP